ncbi:hypothetical protein [Ilumatobacter sp.]|uniref:hypothetical protein n=1 Tax=Ilumatobacter sp. TaxID=1967498 RepID=UPI003C5CC00C
MESDDNRGEEPDHEADIPSDAINPAADDRAAVEPAADEPSASADHTAPDPLVAEIGAAADRVDVGDPTAMLATVQTTATQRRRRRTAVSGLAAAGVLVVSGVVIANLATGGSDDDRIVSAPGSDPVPTEPADSTPTETPPTVTDPATTDAPAVAVADDLSDGDQESSAVTAVPGQPTPVRLVPSAATLVDDPMLTGAAGLGQHELFRWKDGFLSIRTSFEPQPLPSALPDEVVAAFPPEVVDLFPDGLPPTIDEAIEILQEAGMLDVVTEILSNNSAVYDAVYSAQPTAPVRTIRFSPDGVEWREIDAAFPEGVEFWNEATSTGDRFVFSSITTVEPAAPADDTIADVVPPVPETIEIHSSTDLINWSVQTIPVPERPADVDPTLPYSVYSHGLAAIDDGYIISIDASIEFDPVRYLDPELQERINTGGGMSVSEGDAGVTIGLYGEDSDGREPDETLTFTWEELGIDGPPSLDSTNMQHRYAGTWDGALTESTDTAGGWFDVAAIGDVFVEFGPEARQSPDGIEWSPIDLPDAEFVDAIIETPDGVVVRTTDGRGAPMLYAGDLDAGGWSTVAVPELPDGAQPQGLSQSAFLFADYGEGSSDDPYVDSVGSTESAEVDGYRYELESTSSGDKFSATYQLTEIATGNVVVTETSDGGGAGEPFEYLDYQSDFGDGFRILDPATGEPIVTISYDDVTRQIIAADGSVIDMAEMEMPEPFEGEMRPEFWVLAFVDDGWMLQQVSSGENSAENVDEYPSSVAVADDVALVAWSDGKVTRVTAS